MEAFYWVYDYYHVWTDCLEIRITSKPYARPLSEYSTTFTLPVTLSLWLNMVRGGLERLLVYGPGFNSQGWPGNLDQDRVRVCFEINFSDRKEGLSVSSIICDH